ncbi:hypothetical protein CONCODRAFT_10338 [Conidiobolus coronatus NRRL 28638]|uniref:Ion transport domain-containing protein n=1 Tax=Conidiobolus coronatus (strain ATCC 28846 / CBS 209.66 / NRRL 28638) TaxID=796925 RepID=A0A137NXJ1_CONC2|nr:hypothetical protein CONCODRAFT_10338 [Conidiobolus coronatus NRRL 28638]|eukprot:KXN67573.1 hypothetical protein CONCODRAFT_10338 [Conidiobolus coronatus NRRL 28638]
MTLFSGTQDSKTSGLQRFKKTLSNILNNLAYHYFTLFIVFLDLSLLLTQLILVLYSNKQDDLWTAVVVLFAISWVFPSIFIIEVLLRIWVDGWITMRPLMKKIDFGILIFSVVSDAILYVTLVEHRQLTATFVIIFRCWKVFRVFFGILSIMKASREKIEEEILAKYGLSKADLESGPFPKTLCTLEKSRTIS